MSSHSLEEVGARLYMPGFRHIMTYIGIALAVSFDGLAVGALYGAKRLCVPSMSLVSVSALTGALMSCSMKAGRLLGGLASHEGAGFWGGVIMVGLGTWQGWQTCLEMLNEKTRVTAGDAPPAYRPHALSRHPRLAGTVVQILREPLAADQDSSGVIDSRESIALGLALGLDAFAAGFGASLSGFSLLIVPLVAVACPLFLVLGCRLGRGFRSSSAFGKCYALPAVVLVSIGLLKIMGYV